MLRCVNFHDLYAPSDDSDVAKRLQQLTYPYADTAGLSYGKGRRTAVPETWLGRGPLNRAWSSVGSGQRGEFSSLGL
jgi:hypothetical protein